MSSPKSTNYTSIIVAGAFFRSNLYTKLTSALEAASHYPASAISLLSVDDGTRLPPATMADDAAHIRSAILAALDSPDDPRDVVLVLHSYSGFPGTCAVQGLDRAARAAEGKFTAVVGLVYIASFMPPEGMSLRGKIAGMPALPEEYRLSRGGYLPAITEEVMFACMNDMPAEEALANLPNTALHSSDSYDGKVWFEGWKVIPALQVVSGRDVIVPREMQEEMFVEARAAGANVVQKVFENASHGLTISLSDELAHDIVLFVSGAGPSV
ncbi:Alpha/beta hydrolase fold-1 [Penicillium hispanicum]|uniref:Alpha/beta hydrolase fold-1 n=1 Tax=Penicillium hispanicum TaxID=1080232 RepID=UPI0025414341|nr:Alpha/beta hydrolase fold-1 [Penicillium hispanicum]KAJ5594695.1 Alpha/beta hydrolase fold-1 [Penicillium hispanicum]